MTRGDIFKAINRDDLVDFPFDPYLFLEAFHPDYYRCDNIAWMDDLDKYIDGEYDPKDLNDSATRMAHAFPDKYDAYVEHLRLYCQEMLRAVKTYQSLRYPNGILPY